MEGNGTFNIISVADPAIQSHLDHGDHAVLTFYLDGDGLWERFQPTSSATVDLYSDPPDYCRWIDEGVVVSYHTGLSNAEMFVCDDVTRAQAAQLGAPCVAPTRPS